MKILNKLTLSAALSLTSTVTFASSGLILCGEHYNSNITISCRTNDGLIHPGYVPIPANACTLAGTPLSWILIQAVVFGGHPTAHCVFKEGDREIGSVQVSVNASLFGDSKGRGRGNSCQQLGKRSIHSESVFL